jgi:hypothetical protein
MQRTGGENEGTRPADRHSSATDSLAEDVARLYSWANLGENSYRSFARIGQPPPLPPSDTAKGTTAPDQNDLSKEPVRVRFSDPSKRPAGADGVRNSVVGIYSVTAGVGKTSLCANLGRMLCSLGERILLADVTGGGHLINVCFMVLLLTAETYAFVVLYLGYIQAIRPLRRMPAPLPKELEAWPHVDVLIPTYNEPLSVVRSTAFAAMNIDYPGDKVHVYLLDDGKREEFRKFCEDAAMNNAARLR